MRAVRDVGADRTDIAAVVSRGHTGPITIAELTTGNETTAT